MKPMLPWVLLVVALALPAGLALRGALRAEPPRLEAELGTVPDFELVERSGRLVRAADLKGRPWIADFVYTRCDGVCPALSARMARLQERLTADVSLVSFSVDPAHDTPAVLRDYASRFRAAPDRWLFLTGDVATVRSLVSEGFHLAIAGADHGGPITHSDRIALVDRDLRIRRYYDGMDDDWIESVLRDLESLREAG